MNNGRFATGVGMGMVAGIAVGMLLKPTKKYHKNGVSRALKTVSDVMEDVGEMLGL